MPIHRPLVSYLKPVTFAEGVYPFRDMGTKTRFGWTVGEDGEPLRVEGPRI